MSFFSQASLVMIPSGYKASKVYSAVPTDGSGDLSFTRTADTATRVGPDGLIEKVRTNRLLQSNTFSTTWLFSGTGTVTTGATDPFGGTTAWTLAKTAANTFLYQSTAGFLGSFTFSIYAKAGTVDQLWLNHDQSGSFSSYFDLTLGTAISPAGCVATIVSVGGGWYRCSIAGTVAAPNNIRIYPASGGTISGTTGNILIYGIQAETGDIATDYIATTSAAVSVGPVANVPRLDYLNSSCPRLLLEPQRTNVALQSESLNTAPNVVDASTFTANVYTSPSGTQSADQLTETTANDKHGFYQYTTVTAQAYTASVFTKQTGRRYISFTSDVTGTQVISFFDLQTKSVLTSASGHTCSVQDYGDGWLRLIVSFTASAGNRFLIWGGSINGTNNTYAGSTSVSQTFWGYQLEAGAYATSYIPTLGAAVTRGGDAASKTSISSLIGQSEGTVFLQFDNRLLTSYPNEYTFQIIGSGGHQIWMRKESGATTFTARLIVSSSTIWTFASIPVPNGDTKIAISYKTGDSALYLNGTQFGSTNTAAFSGSSFTDFYFNLSGTANPELILNQALLFKTRLSNSELAALTA